MGMMMTECSRPVEILKSLRPCFCHYSSHAHRPSTIRQVFRIQGRGGRARTVRWQGDPRSKDNVSVPFRTGLVVSLVFFFFCLALAFAWGSGLWALALGHSHAAPRYTILSRYRVGVAGVSAPSPRPMAYIADEEWNLEECHPQRPFTPEIPSPCH